VPYSTWESRTSAQSIFPKRSASSTNLSIKESQYRMSGHFIYAGIVRWFEGLAGDAVALWKAGLKSHYAGDSGMDVPLLLFYAGVREPSAFDSADAETLIREKRKDLDPEDLPYALGRFVLGDIEETELREVASDVTGRAMAAQRACQLAQAEFYIATHALRRGDRKGFLTSMERCANAKSRNDIYHEQILARWEVTQARGKRRRK
jgi:lipoprotein NlpI